MRAYLNFTPSLASGGALQLGQDPEERQDAFTAEPGERIDKDRQTVAVLHKEGIVQTLIQSVTTIQVVFNDRGKNVDQSTRFLIVERRPFLKIELCQPIGGGRSMLKSAIGEFS